MLAFRDALAACPLVAILRGVLGLLDALSKIFNVAGNLLFDGILPVGRRVPDVLLSGDHARIDAWRRDNLRPEKTA